MHGTLQDRMRPCSIPCLCLVAHASILSVVTPRIECMSLTKALHDLDTGGDST